MSRPDPSAAPSLRRPALLPTATDLAADEVRAVENAVNPLIADALALYIKTKGFHWHVTGPHFRDWHLMLDEHAEQLLDAVDPLAERVRKLGGATLRSVGHVARLTAVADADEPLPPSRMLAELLADNRRMAEAQREAIAICSRSRDEPTSNILQELLDATERRVWFLFAMTREEA